MLIYFPGIDAYLSSTRDLRLERAEDIERDNRWKDFSRWIQFPRMLPRVMGGNEENADTFFCLGFCEGPKRYALSCAHQCPKAIVSSNERTMRSLFCVTEKNQIRVVASFNSEKWDMVGPSAPSLLVAFDRFGGFGRDVDGDFILCLMSEREAMTVKARDADTDFSQMQFLQAPLRQLHYVLK